MIRTAILGGTGYGGMELLRLLLAHPEVEVTALTSRTEDGPVGERYPHLRGFTDLRFTREDAGVREALARDNDLLLYAKPHGVAATELPALLDAAPNVRIVDLSGDFRLKDAAAYPEWYDFTHPDPDRLAEAVYGLPECGRREDLRAARLVANPGCHAIATILAIWPLANAGHLNGRVSVVSVTGSSGGGARAKRSTHHPERFANFKAYRPLRHQHLPEIVQALGAEARIDFVPHSAPIARGIHVTAFTATPELDANGLRACYESAYGDEPFVRLFDATPDVRAVAGTNMVDVSTHAGDGVACITLAIDNLGKGMAGTAVQNLNLMFGLDETTALNLPGAGL